VGGSVVASVGFGVFAIADEYVFLEALKYFRVVPAED